MSDDWHAAHALDLFCHGRVLVAQTPDRSDIVAPHGILHSKTLVAKAEIAPNPDQNQSTPPALSLPEHGGDAAIAGADYSTWLVAIYLSGVVVMLARVVLGIHGGRRLCRQAVQVEDPALLIGDN